mmetsp:Transcript_31605/g.52746  ORF Transcript_31605/g.52746 Transcript_31605/m.52746 type:complete len:258 (-) Transcript_31605:258-1031(-)
MKPSSNSVEESAIPKIVISANEISQAKRSLWDETAKGLGNVIGNINDAWYGEQAVYYTRERERLEKYIPPFRYGASATLFLFFSFRVTGNPNFQRWRRGIWERLRPTKLETAPPQKHQTPATAPMGYLETKRKTEVEQALKSMKFLTDFLVSLSVGTSGTLFLLESKKDDIRIDYEESPLVPGRSVVADEMCPGMLQLYQNHSSVRHILVQGQHDPNLATVATFVKNCQKRANYESKIRQEQGKSEDEPIIVPYTGL